MNISLNKRTSFLWVGIFVLTFVNQAIASGTEDEAEARRNKALLYKKHSQLSRAVERCDQIVAVPPLPFAISIASLENYRPEALQVEMKSHPPLASSITGRDGNYFHFTNKYYQVEAFDIAKVKLGMTFDQVFDTLCANQHFAKSCEYRRGIFGTGKKRKKKEHHDGPVYFTIESKTAAVHVELYPTNYVTEGDKKHRVHEVEYYSKLDSPEDTLDVRDFAIEKYGEPTDIRSMVYHMRQGESVKKPQIGNRDMKLSWMDEDNAFACHNMRQDLQVIEQDNQMPPNRENAPTLSLTRDRLTLHDPRYSDKRSAYREAQKRLKAAEKKKQRADPQF